MPPSDDAVLTSDYLTEGLPIPDSPERVIVLNGTSSSGKSSTAAALQALLPGT